MAGYTKFKDWTLVRNKDGGTGGPGGYEQTFWLHSKTGEMTTEHPSKKYFKINRN